MLVDSVRLSLIASLVTRSSGAGQSRWTWPRSASPGGKGGAAMVGVAAVMVVGADGAMGAVGEAVVAATGGAMATGTVMGIERVAAGVAGRMMTGERQRKAKNSWVIGRS